MGGAMLGCVGFVQAAKNTKGKTKGRMMFLHKSCGLLAAGLMVPRLAVRAIAKMPPAIGHAQWEKAIADLSHRMMYAFIVIMPMTGVAMGYFGGKGLPFFYTTLPGATEKNGTIAKYAFEVHHYAGQAMEYLLVAHLGGVAFHMMKGQHILARIIPGLAK